MKTLPKIPDPSSYGISVTQGFLSPQAPLDSFPNLYYKPWDDLASDLPSLIKSGTLSSQVASLPHLQTDQLKTDLDFRRAYVLLAFTIHSSVWSTTPPTEVVPPQLAEPFLEVCEHLGTQPVISYASLCSWNWHLIDRHGPMELENMDILASFTGTRAEAAFYHVPVLTEYEGGHLVHLLLHAIELVFTSPMEEAVGPIVQALEQTSQALVKMAAQISKLYPVLDPKFFYHEHRPYMAGGKGMEDKGLHRGMVFQRLNGKEVEMKLVGGSAVQSSLFPFLDYVLGVKHVDGTLFSEMRDYMPGAHRAFLSEVSDLANQGYTLRDYVAAHPEEPSLRLAFNKCLQQLRSWRGKHIALVSKYIVQPAREAEKAMKIEVDGTNGHEGDQEWELQGTGGSAVMPFLRQSRDETVGVAAVG